MGNVNALVAMDKISNLTDVLVREVEDLYSATNTNDEKFLEYEKKYLPIIRKALLYLQCLNFDAQTGAVYVDHETLKENDREYIMARIKDLEKSIFESTGCKFNILNPIEVRKILVKKLGLPDKKLEYLAADYVIAADILEYQNLAYST